MWNYTQTPSSDELMHWASGQTAPKHKWIERIKTSKGYRYIYNHSAIAQKKAYYDAQQKYGQAAKRLSEESDYVNDSLQYLNNPRVKSGEIKTLTDNFKVTKERSSRLAANYAQEVRKQKANMEVAKIRYNNTWTGKLKKFFSTKVSVTVTTSSNLYPEKKISVKLH